MKISVVVVLQIQVLFVYAGDSAEDHPPFGAVFVDPFAPTTVNFNEIFTNSLSMLNEESPLSTIGKDEDFHLSNLPVNMVEFRQHTVATTTTTTPKPRFPKASFLKAAMNFSSSTYTPSSTDATLSSPETPKTNNSKASNPKAAALVAPSPAVEVLPLKNAQRGVLDLIFPASRVRNFKSVFDTVRRILSYTFK